MTVPGSVCSSRCGTPQAHRKQMFRRVSTLCLCGASGGGHDYGKNAVTLTLADGEARAASMFPDGSYACPFCSGAVISPAGWDENEANNARIYAAQGDAYTVQPYPHWQRETWEARGCGNPACLVSLNAAQLADHARADSGTRG